MHAIWRANDNANITNLLYLRALVNQKQQQQAICAEAADIILSAANRTKTKYAICSSLHFITFVWVVWQIAKHRYG